MSFVNVSLSSTLLLSPGNPLPLLVLVLLLMKLKDRLSNSDGYRSINRCSLQPKGCSAICDFLRGKGVIESRRFIHETTLDSLKASK